MVWNAFWGRWRYITKKTRERREEKTTNKKHVKKVRIVTAYTTSSGAPLTSTADSCGKVSFTLLRGRLCFACFAGSASFNVCLSTGSVCKVLDCRCFFRESLRGTPTVRVRGCVPSCSALPTKEKKNSNGANNTATKKEEVEPPKAPGRVSNSFVWSRGGTRRCRSYVWT